MGCFVAVPQDRVYMVETCGNFQKVAGPGFHCIGLPGVCTVAGRLSTRICQMIVNCETKTKDNVFVNFAVAVQYKICQDKAFEANYVLWDPRRQIQSYIYDAVRAAVPKLDIDDVYLAKDDIAKEIKADLSETMETYGFEIVDALVVDVELNLKVKQSMNLINANKRLRLAAVEKAEANKLQIVKDSEAEADSKYLSGVGLARKRKAIVDCLRESVNNFSKEVSVVDSKNVMDLVLLTQYFDTIKDIAKNRGTKAILYCDQEGPFQEISEELRSSLLMGNIKVE